MTISEIYGNSIDNSVESGPYIILGVWIGSFLYEGGHYVWKFASQKEQMCTKVGFRNINIDISNTS